MTMHPAGRALLTAALALAPVAVAGNLALTPSAPNAPAVLWCCATRERLSPTTQPPPAPATRSPATVRRFRRAQGLRRLRKPAPRKPGGPQTAHLLLSGLTCGACIQRVEGALLAVPGVTAARVRLSSARATVSWDPAYTDLDRLIAAVTREGFGARVYDPAITEAPMQAMQDAWLMRVAVAGFGMVATTFLAEPAYYGAITGADAVWGQLMRTLGMVMATATGGLTVWPFLRGAWAGLRRGRLGMDVLISLGALATYIASLAGMATGGAIYFDSLLMLLFLLVAGRWGEAAARSRAYGAMEHLLGDAPTAVQVLRAGRARSVLPHQLEIGDEIRLLPGQRVPADGVLTQGSTHVDEAMLTGESRPIAKCVNDTLQGGTINFDGHVRLVLTQVGEQTAFARLAALVREAASARTPAQALADRAGHWGTLAVLAVSLATYLGWHFVDPSLALGAAVAVLIVTCPCALGLATPLALTLAMGRALSRGVLIKRGAALETLSGVRHVVFDKTGTLTLGEPGVVAGLGGDSALALAATLEAGSEHPLARGVLAYARTRGVSFSPAPSDFRAHAGHGVSGTVTGQLARVGQGAWLSGLGLTLPPAWVMATEAWAAAGHTPVWVALGDTVVGAIALGDALRPEAVATIQALRALGVGVTILSGDHPATAQAVGATLGVTDVVANATPSHKREVLAALRARHGAVAMVGDGLNDAPALAAADVGLAMARGADLAVAAADIVIVGGRLSAVPELLALARRTRRVMHDNFALSGVYNAIAIPLAVLGLVTPWLAAILMPASSLVVMANSLRLRKAS